MSAEGRQASRGGRGDILVGLGAVGFAGALLALLPAQVGGETLAAIGDMRSPAFFPVLAGLLTGGLGLLLALRGALAARRAPAPAAAQTSAASPAGGARRVIALAALLVATALALPHAGFLLAVPPMMAGVALAFGYRRPVALAALCLALPVAIFVVFDGALLVLLPRGPF